MHEFIVLWYDVFYFMCDYFYIYLNTALNFQTSYIVTQIIYWEKTFQKN